jgi:hypothetical protein
MAAAAASALEDFGQRLDLCARLRELLREYPQSSLLKELLQARVGVAMERVPFRRRRIPHACPRVLAPPAASRALVRHHTALLCRRMPTMPRPPQCGLCWTTTRTRQVHGAHVC